MVLMQLVLGSCGNVGLLQVVCTDVLLAVEFIWFMA